MKWINYILSFIWRSWFFIMFLIFFIISIPPLFLFTGIIKNNKLVCYIMKYWSRFTLIFSGVFCKISYEESLDPNKIYLFCSNHVSSLDIAVITSTIPFPIVYMGKSELCKLPIFGYFYKHNSIIVDRNNLKNSYQAFVKAGEKLDDGLNVCIFPEGGIPHPSVLLRKFKNGVFRLATEKEINIVPITLLDNKRHFPSEYYKGMPGFVRIKVHSPIKANNYEETSSEKLKDMIYEIIYSELNNDRKNKSHN